MDEDSDQRLGEPCGLEATEEDGAHATLVSGDLALDQPALSVERARETSAQSATKGSQRPLAPAVALMDPDDALRDAKGFEGALQIGFGIIAGISQDAVERNPLMRLGDEGSEVGVVRSRAHADPGRQEERGIEVGHERDFDPARTLEFPRRSAIPVVIADMTGVEARGIDGGDGIVGDQATIAGASKDGVEQSVEDPFFSKRCSATQSVE